MALRQFGPADNREFYQEWLRSDVLFDSLFLSSIDIAPLSGVFNDPLVPTLTYLAWYGRSLQVHPGKPVNRSNVMVAGWADLMGPKILNAKFLNRDIARTTFVDAVYQLVQPTVLADITVATRATYVDSVAEPVAAQAGERWDRVLRGRHPPVGPVAPEMRRPGVGLATPDDAMAILMYIASTAHTAFSIGGVSMIVHVYLAVLKRGTMSEAFTEKIINGLKDDLQISGLRIDPMACSQFYRLYGQKIDETTIRDVTEHWTGLLPATAMRLRLTVTQASGSGLTALITTGRAILLFRDFNWSRIRQIYLAEWERFGAAVEAVGNNPWYGFRHDLGAVSSTKYKNLAYVAKELLIKVQGEASLRSYAGWTRRAQYQAIVDQMVADYEVAKTRSVLEGQAMPEVGEDPPVDELRAILRGHVDVYV